MGVSTNRIHQSSLLIYTGYWKMITIIDSIISVSIMMMMIITAGKSGTPSALAGRNIPRSCLRPGLHHHCHHHHHQHYHHHHHHHHLHTPPNHNHHHHQVQIIGTLVRLEALGVVFGIIGFAIGCYIFIVVWSFR